ncbi:hypothetical protein [Microbispora rosea]|uniref:hypothetical protein n=1 Tax=Microbispora rosea TaxID=58117 RepID=UPI003D942755
MIVRLSRMAVVMARADGRHPRMATANPRQKANQPATTPSQGHWRQMPTEFRQASKHVNLRQVVVLPTNQAGGPDGTVRRGSPSAGTG